MHAKRGTSVSVADLHLQTVQDNIKRLALGSEEDNHPHMALSIQNPNGSNAPILTVMSNAQDDFKSRYDMIREIGKGGFSTVYQCRHRTTGVDYAVKVVDLRPLRLRERFNPTRLKREVEIMRRLNHPNIIQFVEVYEDADHLMMVMEYCPGQELFDVILARRYFNEEDAKPIFAQISRALYYLHSLNIIHRDIKPENVLILSTPDAHGGLIAKLLDFGLSKNAAAGSAAKTFVGTPCYLAPEVEYTSKGLGGTYGLPADCWSLGSVLYVMLVARFPEFEQDITGKIVVKLPPALFQNISSEAKDLIRSLMNTNPNARMTMSGTLQHPWLGKYRATTEELTSIAVSNSDLSQHLQEEEDLVASLDNSQGRNTEDTLTAGGQVVHHQAMVIRQNEPHGNGQGFGPEQLQLSPLLQLQRSIATCFEEAHAQYQDYPEVAAQVRRGAVLCRQQLVESTKMLRKVEQTAKEVLNMFPDLELAVEEEEPQLAAEFFNIVKGWVMELREQVMNTQKINKASMLQIQRVVEQSSVNLQKEQETRRQHSDSVSVPIKMLEALLTKMNIQPGVPVDRADTTAVASATAAAVADVSLDTNQVLELFMSLFSAQQQQKQHYQRQSQRQIGKYSPQGSRSLMDEMMDIDTGSSNHHNHSNHSNAHDVTVETVSENSPHYRAAHGDGYHSYQTSGHPSPYPPPFPSTHQPGDDLPDGIEHQMLPPPYQPTQRVAVPSSSSSSASPGDMALVSTSPPTGQEGNLLALTDGSSSPRAARKLTEALHKLRQVDLILEQLSVFWANTEVILDLLTKKGQHVEQFIGFASKPRLMARFRERMEEYKRFWEGIQLMCSNYIVGVQTSNDRQKMYGFLGKGEDMSSMSTSSGATAAAGATGVSTGDSFDSLNSAFFGDQAMNSRLSGGGGGNGGMQYTGMNMGQAHKTAMDL